METEERLKSKCLYKLFLILLKYMPVLLTLVYVSNTILCRLGIDAPILSNIGGLSLFPWIFLYIATYVFKFCTYHRLLLYYILLDDSLNIYDYYFPIPIEDTTAVTLHFSLIGILVLLLLLQHAKVNKEQFIENPQRYRNRQLKYI